MNAAKGNKKEVRGAITRYTCNRHEDYDGFILDQDGAMMDVKFPPHTARFIREIAEEGDNVSLVLQETPHPPHHKHGPKDKAPKLQLVSIQNNSNNKDIQVDSIKPPHPPEIGKVVEFTITKPHFTHGGKDDEITGVIQGENFIHLHPDEYDEGGDTLLAAKTIQVKAKRRTDIAGFVNAKGRIVYHAHSIKIDNHQPA